MQKEEYIKWVTNWKKQHEALVRFQKYIKKCQCKTVYKQDRYRLSENEIIESFRFVVSKDDYYYDKLFNAAISESPDTYYATWLRGMLRSKLHEMYEERRVEKQKFKEEREAA